MRTLEKAIVHARTDKSNPRRGPYDLVICSDQQYTVERTLTPVPQQGFTAGDHYSAYSQLRTGEAGYCISEGEELSLLRDQLETLETLGCNGGGAVATPRPILRRTFDFFRRGELPGCPAGRRFLVVEPDGKLVPCSLRPEPHDSVQSIQRGFTRGNKCGGCYVSIRAYVDRSYWAILADSLRAYRRLISGASVT